AAPVEAVPLVIQAVLTPTKELYEEDLPQDAIMALRKIGPAATGSVPSLIQALGVGDQDMRTRTVLALGALGPVASSAVPELLQTLRNTKETNQFKQSVLKALNQIDPTAAVPGQIMTTPEYSPGQTSHKVRGHPVRGPGKVDTVTSLCRSIGTGYSYDREQT